MLNEAQIATLLSITKKLNANPEHLFQLISFESGWNPTIKNPTSSARGLIQFIDSTAKGMGYAGSADLVAKHPTISSQLTTPVYNYLKPMMPFPTKQSLYMAVFYPAYRNKPADTLFPANVRKANPGIDTPADYIAYVDRRASKIPVPTEIKASIYPKITTIQGLGIAGILLYILKRLFN